MQTQTTYHHKIGLLFQKYINITSEVSMLYENLWILYKNPHYHGIYNWGFTFDATQAPANTIHSLAAHIL